MKSKYLIVFILLLCVLIVYQINHTDPIGDTVTLVWPTTTIVNPCN